MHNIELRMYF